MSEALNISDKAAAKILQVQRDENKPNSVLRVSVVGGGCSGLSYRLSFDPDAGEKDILIVHPTSGVRVVLDPKSLLFLKGTTLDYTDGLEGRGFVFTNPNAKSTCGCGTSFSA